MKQNYTEKHARQLIQPYHVLLSNIRDKFSCFEKGILVNCSENYNGDLCRQAWQLI